MAVEVGKKEDITQLLEETLELARRGQLEQVALVTLSAGEYAKNAIMLQDTSTISLVGSIDMLHSDLTHFEQKFQDEQRQAEQRLLSTADKNNPQ